MAFKICKKVLKIRSKREKKKSAAEESIYKGQIYKLEIYRKGNSP
ncbi:hypothetical protein [Borreliella mayonii]|nr:hypothetical protein [Borreliella mayonii]